MRRCSPPTGTPARTSRRSSPAGKRSSKRPDRRLRDGVEDEDRLVGTGLVQCGEMVGQARGRYGGDIARALARRTGFHENARAALDAGWIASGALGGGAHVGAQLREAVDGVP